MAPVTRAYVTPPCVKALAAATKLARGEEMQNVQLSSFRKCRTSSALTAYLHFRWKNTNPAQEKESFCTIPHCAELSPPDGPRWDNPAQRPTQRSGEAVCRCKDKKHRREQTIYSLRRARPWAVVSDSLFVRTLLTR